MRIAAVILLIIAFLLDVLAGAGYVMFALMGVGAMLFMGTMMGEIAKQAPGEADQAAAKILELGDTFGMVFAAAGALVVIAGFLALIAGIQLLRGRSGKIVYIGCAAAIIADTAPLAMIGFNAFQLPGLLGGLLGLLAVRSLDAVTPAARAKPTAAVSYSSGSASRTGALAPLSAVLIGVGLVGLAAYMKLSGSDAEAAPRPAPQAQLKKPRQKTTASDTAQALPAAEKISGPVKGQLAGQTFNPERVVIEVQTVWIYKGTGSGESEKPERGEKTVLLLDAGNNLEIVVDELPKDYDIRAGLEMRVTSKSWEFGDPTIHLTTPKPGSSFGEVDFVQNDYDLVVKLDPLEGNRVPGRIFLKTPKNKKTRVSGTFSARVDGYPDIEPDLTRGGPGTFKYLVYQHLKSVHPGKEIAITDHAASYQIGDASKPLTGTMKIIYTVDGEETASIFRMATGKGRWQLKDALAATQIPEAHPIEVPDPSNERKWVFYQAAKYTERWFQESHPGKYPWSSYHTGSVNSKLGYADIQVSITPHGETEAIKRRYYYQRIDGEWVYVRDLNEEEKIDRKTGEVSERS